MKRWLLPSLSLIAFATFVAPVFAARTPAPWQFKAVIAATSTPAASTATVTPVDDDPDLPRGLGSEIDKSDYLMARAHANLLRFDGASFDQMEAGRLAGVEQLKRQVGKQAPFLSSTAWTAIGPAPIPNGQTTNISTPVSGRVTAIAVHPTNPDLVFVGLAQGGVWRSIDGGLNWVPLFDQQATLCIGALALAPSDPSILYVGTGEANGSADSYFGLGLYRIDQSGGTPVINGPFNPTPTNDVIGAKTFTGRAIGRILVDPADAATIFVCTQSGIGGLFAEALAASPPITALRGVYRSTDATSGSPSFTKLTVSPAASIAPDVTGNQPINDIIYDPSDPTGNTILAWANGLVAAGNGGIWKTTNAKAAGTFTQTFATTVANIRAAFASTNAGGVPRLFVATGETGVGTSCTSGSGAIRTSLDGGSTWSAKLSGGGGFCGGQCFYDLPIAVSPANAGLVLIGGAGNGTCSRVYARSIDGGLTFSGAGGADVGLHADAHAIVFAPSDPNIVYEGNDGGIYRSADAGATWVSRNTTGLSATQFQSVATHPIDPNFSIGGTQDNGTNWYQPAASWIRADFGDGGNTIIDQNAADNTNVTMYHTYFNQRNNVVAYARVLSTAVASEGNWTVLGQNGNGILLSENPNFYAPLVRGPGNPNTVYYGTDRLHRSTDKGVTNPVVSQAPIAISGTLGVPISSIAIAPTNDNVRLVSLNNFQIWGTVTGSSTLVNMTGAGMPAHSICRLKIDPTNPSIAYAGFGGFGLAAGEHVWKTTNLSTGTPTWAPAGTGLPDVPVNALVIDPVNPTRLWAGTDVGVYESNDGGGNWFPYTTGMPVVAVFDMDLQPVSRTLRAATHGRGMFDRLVDTPVATQLALVGAEIVDGHPRLTWYSADGANELMKLYRRAVPENWTDEGSIYADGTGMVTYEDLKAERGRSYEYRLGIFGATGERMLGQVWVDVPEQSPFALRRGTGSDQVLAFAVSLPRAGDARLDLMDLAGRRVDSIDLSALPAGDHTVQFSIAQRKPGIYWARLKQGEHMLSNRVALYR